MEMPGKKLLSKKLSKIAKEKTGCRTDISLASVDISKHDDKRTIHISIDAEANKKDIKKIIKNLNRNKKLKK